MASSHLFAIELLSLLKAGLNVSEAVRVLKFSHADSPHASAFAFVHNSLSAGQRLSAAIESSGLTCPALFIATIRAAEQASDLVAALERYIAYTVRIHSARRQIVSVLTYPLILSFVGLSVTAFLLLYVVPRFAGIYEDISGDAPFFSAMLLSTGRWVGQNSFWLGGLALASATAFVSALIRTDGRNWLITLEWLPRPLYKRIRVFYLTRLYRTLSMLLRSGFPFLEALNMSASLLPRDWQGAAKVAGERLKEGHTISAAFAFAGLSTPIAAELLLVGERTGDMSDTLDRIADFHDESLARWLDVGPGPC